jgi:GrpB-like predicted nucleotidyltransferase (UPF0157 family)
MNGAHTQVEVVPYDPDWVRRFHVTKDELRSLFPGAAIEHIGSTSVPGLSSKDTIDVAVGVCDVSQTLDAVTLLAMRRQGFEHVPASFAKDPDHAFFHRIVADRRTDHVHVVRSDSDAMTGYLLFRDFLRATPAAVRRYETAKRDLARRFAFRRDDYVTQKQPVVDALMVEARAWAHRTERPSGKHAP